MPSKEVSEFGLNLFYYELLPKKNSGSDSNGELPKTGKSVFPTQVQHYRSSVGTSTTFPEDVALLLLGTNTLLLENRREGI